MARTVIPLTDTKIRTSKVREKDYKLFDGRGLFLLITKNNSKLWRFKYKFDAKEKLLALGAYPEISLSKARELREKYRTDIANKIDPNAVKKVRKETIQKGKTKVLNTFELLARERLTKQKDSISETHYKRTITAFKNDCFKYIGHKPIDEITAKDIISILQIMHDRGVNDSARKLFYAISKTFKWAVANGKAERNPASDILLEEILGKTSKQHYPTITDETGIKNLLTSIKEYGGESSTKYSLLMLAYTFVRPINIRLALWSEIDFKYKQWVIPAKKIKTKDEFIVPLSDSVIELLKDIKLYSGDSPYIFPSTKSKTTPLSDGALLGAIRRMGYTGTEFTPHGFRAMFSTIAHEKSNFKYDVIETQLAHSVGNSVSQAYNRAKYLDERVELMQWWSNYLNEVQK
ncbi:MAG: integrase arm-type DNA-binding domain-containing protein [Sulfurimonas sp.]|nr:integrase arm-type DNA-binding domain-containing protein [Sulfurimonas sp.]